MLRNYLTELKNILTEPNPYKTVISPSEGAGDWMEGICRKKGTDLFSKNYPPFPITSRC